MWRLKRRSLAVVSGLMSCWKNPLLCILCIPTAKIAKTTVGGKKEDPTGVILTVSPPKPSPVQCHESVCITKIHKQFTTLPPMRPIISHTHRGK